MPFVFKSLALLLSISAGLAADKETPFKAAPAASYASHQSNAQITIGVDLIRNVNLQQLWPGYNFVLIGDKPWHPANHLATQNTIDAIVAITQDYSSHYYSDPNYTTMGVNDEALEWGGVFDICETYAAACKEGVLPWQPPHKSHDNGLAADFRANGDPNSIVSNAFEDFKNYCRVPGRLGNYVKTEGVGTSNQHIHCDSN